MLSKVGMVMATNGSKGDRRLEAWILPICGDSQAFCVSEYVITTPLYPMIGTIILVPRVSYIVFVCLCL